MAGGADPGHTVFSVFGRGWFFQDLNMGFSLLVSSVGAGRAHG
ncbi:hypothetical protein NBRC3293_1939 [Gluconobacter oxydans NBRC 3293]|uniref:Uncharacterized protein n=1 Tax=Gluconobacter oxydans NBRC 3293 TaxID=1315969 RepID=A0A829X363_GLUOY|nr:hypothetical protein NBRC3293_1939 [Gluconobacter oxydans NBRC 3293]